LLAGCFGVTVSMARHICGAQSQNAYGGFCKSGKKIYDDTNGLEEHERRRQPRPPPINNRFKDGKR
jgi:hypothetical protein